MERMMDGMNGGMETAAPMSEMGTTDGDSAPKRPRPKKRSSRPKAAAKKARKTGGKKRAKKTTKARTKSRKTSGRKRAKKRARR